MATFLGYTDVGSRFVFGHLVDQARGFSSPHFFCKSSPNILNSCLIKLIWFCLSCCDKVRGWFNICIVFVVVRFCGISLFAVQRHRHGGRGLNAIPTFTRKQISALNTRKLDTRIDHKYYIFLVSSALLSKILLIHWDWLSLYIKLLINY